MNEVKPNFIDKAVGFISPKRGLERIIYRQKMFRYEAAVGNRMRVKATQPLSTQENNRYVIDRVQLIRETRDLAENEPIIKSMLWKIANYSVGKMLYQSLTEDPKARDEYEEFFKDWCKRCDITNRHTFGRLGQLSLMSMYTDGDIGTVLMDNGDNIVLKSIEGDLIGNPNQVMNSNSYASGILLDFDGAPTGYRIYQRDINSLAYHDPIDIPSQHFVHLFDPMRTSQYRGVSAFTPGINTIKDLHDILENERFAVKQGSSITTVTTNPNGEPTDPNIYKDVVQDPNGVSRVNNIESYEAGTNRYAQPGEEVKMFDLNRPSVTFQGFAQMLVRLVALSVNLPYGFVYDLGSLGGVSARLDSAQAQREIERIQELFVEKWANPIKQVVLARAIQAGKIRPTRDWNKGKWQFSAHVTADIGHESDAAIQEVRAGLRTRTDWYGQKGQDFDEQSKVIVQETDAAFANAKILSDKYKVPIEYAMSILEQRSNNPPQVNTTSPTPVIKS